MILTTGIITVGAYVRKKAKIDETKSYINILTSALQEYKNYKEANFPGYPAGNGDNMQNLFVKLNDVPNCRKILDKIPSEKLQDDDNNGVIDTVYDAWSNPMEYVNTGSGNFPTIRSAGPDETFNTADDITSDTL